VPRDQIDGLGQVFRPRGKNNPGYGAPRLLREVKPQYTADAMRNKVQGTVVIEAVVQPDGSIGEACVVNRLDSELDLEAVKAARRWQFDPGTIDGTPVPVLVLIELTFTLR
jgi:TonB family protein